VSEQNPWWHRLPRTQFGSAEHEERLAALIIAGRKRATVWSAEYRNETVPGMRWVVTVGDKPVAIIETVTVEQSRFDTVDTDFAYEEGEGDRSLAFWTAEHESFFRHEGHFAGDMLLWCEHFRLVEVLDPALAIAAAAHVDEEQAEGEALRFLLKR